jgi:hypothetical protein
MAITPQRRFESKAATVATGVIPVIRAGLPAHLKSGEFAEPARSIVFAADTPKKTLHVKGDALTGTIVLQGSNDGGATFVDLASATTVGAMLENNSAHDLVRINGVSITVATNVKVYLNMSE